MLNKRGKVFICLVEIILLIFMSFAISFVIGKSLVFVDAYVYGSKLRTLPSGSTPLERNSIHYRFPSGEIAQKLSDGSYQIWHIPEVKNPVILESGSQALRNSGDLGYWDEKSGKFVDSPPDKSSAPAGEKGTEGADKDTLSPTTIITSLYKGELLGKAAPWHLGGLIAGAAWGVSLGLGVKALEGFLGIDKQITEPLQKAIFYGSLGGGAVKTIFGWAGKESIGKYSAKSISQFAGAAIAIAVFLATYKSEKTEIVRFVAYPYQPPTGGRYCEECS